MLRIVGYADRFSVRPGEDVRFHVSSENSESYEAEIVRLIHGDTNPAGPGYKEVHVPSSVSGEYPGRKQTIHAGSYVLVPDDPRLHVGSFTLQAFIFPTTPENGVQALLTKWEAPQNKGFGLFIDDSACLALWIGDSDGNVARVSSGAPLQRNLWYLAVASFDAATRRIRLMQKPVVTNTNGGFHVALVHPAEDITAAIEKEVNIGAPATNGCPFLMAADTERPRSGRFVSGGHYKQLSDPLGLPVHGKNYNGKIDRPRLANRAIGMEEAAVLAQDWNAAPTRLRSSLVGAWDFHANIVPNAASTHVVDSSSNGLHGTMINMPARGMTGHNWSGAEMSYRHAPEQYGAIHFHDDDLDDARWSVDFSYTVPDTLKSGVYAARLRIDGVESEETEDYVPFFVRPPKGSATAPLAVIIPTSSYLAYANDHLGPNAVLAEVLAARVPIMQINDLFVHEHREYGGSQYDLHADGSGVNISTRLRPILNMRPKHRHWLSPSLWQANADLHLIDWLEEQDIPYDVHTDEDLHIEGVDLLNRYRVVLTGTHPEYSSERMLDAYQAYQIQGGRWLYLGGNGFYWCSEFHPDNPAITEVRKGEAGSRAYCMPPGEKDHAFDGKFGGMWRARGRRADKICGLTFSAYGFDVSSYYRRGPDSRRADCAWIFEGVGEDEIIGDFGLIGDGAAGLEIDRVDFDLGTPAHVRVLATSEGHTDLMRQVNEEILLNCRGAYGGGDENPMVRADMVYYKTPNDGAVFAPGSITWCGCLSHNNYDNNVSKIMKNVIRGFLMDGPLP